MSGPFAQIANQATTAASNKTAGSLIGAATVAPKLYDFSVSASGSPADNVIIYTLQRSTVDGTGTTVTPTSISQSPGIVTPIAALCTTKSNYTAEPTYTAGVVIWSQGINQRSAFRWVAVPGGEVVIPAIAAAGLGFQVKSAGYAGQCDVSYHWLE
ncbi:MAG: hypothetical protein C5B59_17280 [Bacteroidetes bacterium]|nr:MAG: hypothetical protein C5B59_17280 [Bacteroidota bacterium]